MRFCDFFIEYKLILKNVKSTIPWRELPLYRKIAIIFIFIIGVIGIISAILNLIILAAILFSSFVILMTIYFIIDSSTKNQRMMLDEHYIKYSEKRMNAFYQLLEKYRINPADRETINLLIEQTKIAKTKEDIFLSLKKPAKTLGTIIIPIIVYLAQKLGEASSIDELLTMGIQIIMIIICIAAILVSLAPITRDLLNKDLLRYDDLIYDLNQTLIFYKKEG